MFSRHCCQCSLFLPISIKRARGEFTMLSVNSMLLGVRKIKVFLQGGFDIYLRTYTHLYIYFYIHIHIRTDIYFYILVYTCTYISTLLRQRLVFPLISSHSVSSYPIHSIPFHSIQYQTMSTQIIQYHIISYHIISSRR